jgi:hypothetical protein
MSIFDVKNKTSCTRNLCQITPNLYMIITAIYHKLLVIFEHLEYQTKISIKKVVERSQKIKIECTNNIFSCKIKIVKTLV